MKSCVKGRVGKNRRKAFNGSSSFVEPSITSLINWLKTLVHCRVTSQQQYKSENSEKLVMVAHGRQVFTIQCPSLKSLHKRSSLECLVKKVFEGKGDRMKGTLRKECRKHYQTNRDNTAPSTLL